MYTPKGGVDVTTQYMPKGGKDITSQSQGNPVGQSSNGVENFTRGASDVLRTLGLGILPNTAANITDEAKHFGSKAMGGNGLDTSQEGYDNPFRTQEQYKETYNTNPAVNYGEDMAGAASYLVPETKVMQGAGIVAKGVKAAARGAVRGELQATAHNDPLNPAYAAGGAILEPLFKALGSGMLTKGGVAKATEKAATKATQEGQFIHWDDLMQQAKDKVIKKFGDNAAVREALGNVTAPRTPAGIESLPETLQQTPEKLLQLRRNLSNSYGKSLFQSSSDKGIGALEEKIAAEVRGTVADNLHKLAPNTVSPDQLYGIYAKSGPLLMKALKNLGIPAGILAAGYEGSKLLH